MLVAQSQTHQFEIVAMQTDGDYIHMLIDWSPQHSIPSNMKALKGNTNKKD